jgi:hypothetical protein
VRSNVTWLRDVPHALVVSILVRLPERGREKELCIKDSLTLIVVVVSTRRDSL